MGKVKDMPCLCVEGLCQYT